MSGRGVELRIGRLVVRGLDPLGEGRLRDALQRELARSLKALQPEAMAEGAKDATPADIGGIELKPSSTGGSVGTDIAGRIAHCFRGGGRSGPQST